MAVTNPNGSIFVIPVANTVWYTFVGTGSPMTFSTAGSSFDTVVAIYASSGGSFTPVPNGCINDTPTPPIGRTLQAAVTIPTVAGTTYYVQVGGFLGDPPQSYPYGMLKVSLR